MWENIVVMYFKLLNIFFFVQKCLYKILFFKLYGICYLYYLNSNGEEKNYEELYVLFFKRFNCKVQFCKKINYLIRR